MPREVAVVSLYPLNTLDGDERYTFSVAQAIRTAGDNCQLYARSKCGPYVLTAEERLDTAFSRFAADERSAGDISCRELLCKLADFDIVWIHEFLSSDIVFDLICAVASDQCLLFTNPGHEPLAPRFRAFYCHAKNHFFVEISKDAADRSRRFGPQSLAVAGPVWQSQFCAWDSNNYWLRVVDSISNTRKI